MFAEKQGAAARALNRIGCGSLVGLLLCVAMPAQAVETTVVQVESDKHNFYLTPLVSGLEHPWGLAFLPDGSILITERAGRLRLVRDGQLEQAAISGLPKIAVSGQGGLLDVALHPQFEQNRLIYLSYSAGNLLQKGTEVIRGRLQDMQLQQVQTIFKALPKKKGSRHFGSRLLFLSDGTLLITLGDRGARPSAQDLGQHPGAVVRLRDDGNVPEDNPFLDHAGAQPETYSYGHRNIQGIAWQPDPGRLWVHEHGPMGGDELNLLEPGLNYGWPIVTYGVNYVSGTQISEITEKEGMEQPVYYWVPSIAPSGLSFYTGDAFPGWKGSLFIGSLRFSLLVRLELDGTQVKREERMLQQQIGRIRDVRQGPDDNLYLLTDMPDGMLFRIEPSAETAGGDPSGARTPRQQDTEAHTRQT